MVKTVRERVQIPLDVYFSYTPEMPVLQMPRAILTSSVMTFSSPTSANMGAVDKCPASVLT